MLNSFKIAFRTIRRKKLFSFINIIGLTTGFFCATLIYLYVQNELDYDRFHKHSDRIYRVNQTFIWGESNDQLFSSTGPGVGYAISQEIPEVEQIVRVHTPQIDPVSIVDESGNIQIFNDEIIFAADSNFFSVFSYHLNQGDPKTALSLPNSVVLTEEAATRLFGSKEVVGELLELGTGDGKESLRVTGVVSKYPGNSYVEFDLLISMNTIGQVRRSNWSWMWTTFETFLLIDEKASVTLVQNKLNELPAKHAIQTLEVMGYTYEEYIAAGKEWKLYLQPLTDIHLHSYAIFNRLNQVGNFKIVAALIGSAVFVLILSSINFINLSTSQFTSKAKSAAVRKILGSSKGALRRVYFSEALIFCILSISISVGLTYYFLPIFNAIVGLELSFSLMQSPELIGFLVLLALLVSLLAGAYPAVFFSAFKPMQAMKGELKTGKSSVGIRNGMMVVQYALSLLLIICSFVIYQQLNFVFNADLGFTKENVITINNAHWTSPNSNRASDAFLDQVTKLNGVKSASVCDATPLMVYNGDQFIPDKPEAGSVPLNFVLGDENYLNLLNLNLVLGRGFEEGHSDDKNAIILNETAVQSIGWEVNEALLNKKITNWSGEYHIIGVVRDFNYWSLQSAIEPFAIFHKDANTQNGRPLTRVALAVQASSAEDLDQIIAEIDATWQALAPNRPFEYTVLDRLFSAQYNSEKQFSKVLTAFTFLTILIAALGLLGMVIFTIEQKTKEIGIRKVVGSSMSNIVILFSKGYVKLFGVAFVIAAPIGYFLMNSWLGDFEYRVDLSPMTFIWSGAILLTISLSITIYHTMKASMLNPAEVLKDE